MKIRPKHPIVLWFCFLLAWYIYWVNCAFGNGVEISLQLSVQTFLMVSLGFFCVWEIRDAWLQRWEKVHGKGNKTGGFAPSACDQVAAQVIEIPVPPTQVHGNEETIGGGTLMGSVFWDVNLTENQGGVNKLDTIILCHGYSDSRADIDHIAHALALAGYQIVTYDARGHGESRPLGSKNELLLKFYHDFPAVVDYVTTNLIDASARLYAVGESMGGSTVILGGMTDSRIHSIVALAALSDYRKNLPRVPIPFSKNFWLKLRYAFYGLPMHPSTEINKLLSPALFLGSKSEEMVGLKELVDSRLVMAACRNDKIIPFESTIENARAAGLPESDVYFFERGGHTFLRQETYLVGLLASFLGNTPSRTARPIRKKQKDEL